MIEKLAMVGIAGGSFLFFKGRILRYLRYFQQEEYNGERFLRWLRDTASFDRRGSFACGLAAILAFSFAGSCSRALVAIFGALLLVAIGRYEPDPRVTGKIRLNMTERARRINLVSLWLYGVVQLLVFCCFMSIVAVLPLGHISAWWWLLQILLIQVTPLTLVAANRILSPYEEGIQQGFLEEARDRVAAVKPYVIGITGSYGKTSTKVVLGEMLKVGLGPSFVPPKSFNTLMGNVREIRERLVRGTKYAVMEMGAYGIGSIKRLTELTPPNAAIVTAVGIMHLERYGSSENVFTAKSELAQALPKDGLLICNGDDEGARRMAATYPSGRTLLYGFDDSKADLACLAEIKSESVKGTEFTLRWKGATISLSTKLLGKPAISNITAAFLMAAELGADPRVLAGIIRNLEPVDNRLAVDERGGVTYIRDAYNSNPIGFRAALSVLKNTAAPQRILMTPGMIELGERQFVENESVAEFAGGVITSAIIVGETNREALISGLSKGGLLGAQVITVPTRAEAFAKLSAMTKPGDAVLIENDLSDLYEVREVF